MMLKYPFGISHKLIHCLHAHTRYHALIITIVTWQAAMDALLHQHTWLSDFSFMVDPLTQSFENERVNAIVYWYDKCLRCWEVKGYEAVND